VCATNLKQHPGRRIIRHKRGHEKRGHPWAEAKEALLVSLYQYGKLSRLTLAKAPGLDRFEKPGLAESKGR
jgi:hypothetical protein